MIHETIITGLFGTLGVTLVTCIFKLLEKRADNRNETKAEAKKARDESTQEIKETIDAVGAELREEIAEIKAELMAQKDTDRVILQDRVAWLARSYISKGEIKISELASLGEMHEKYKNTGGNGALNALMTRVHALPIKEED